MTKFSKKSIALFQEWTRYADEDLDMAQLALTEDGPPNQICFHSQQAAEKYLKGITILYGGKFEKSHQLRYLLELACDFDLSFEELKDEAIFLTRFYIETRYPGDIPSFSRKNAEQAYAAVKKIKEFILKKIP